MHNTLVASDYGLLDEDTFEPKPNYWGAVLWRKFMGTTVLDAGVKNGAGLHVYAQCLRGTPGGVALLAINTDTTASRTITNRAQAAGSSIDEERTSMRDIQSLKRFVDPKDIAALCVCLASDAGKSCHICNGERRSRGKPDVLRGGRAPPRTSCFDP
jgi:hypothetical protein